MRNLLVRLSSLMFVWNGYEVDDRFEIIKKICDGLDTLLWPALIITASVGSLYAIFLGIQMARAEDSGKRDEARKHVIRVVIAVAVIVSLILMVKFIIVPNIGIWLAVDKVNVVE